MLTAKLILERLDKDHHLVQRQEQPSRSFLLQFIQTLYLPFVAIEDGLYSINDYSGAARAVDSDGSPGPSYGKSHLMIGSPPGNSMIIGSTGNYYGSAAGYLACLIEGQYVGIQVGTGTNVVTPTDYALQTRIAHGGGGGEFEYGGCELLDLLISDPNGQFTIRRYFTNHSGGPITVEEVGIYGVITRGDVIADQAVWAACFARDLTGGVAVADTEILRVTYVPQITV